MTGTGKGFSVDAGNEPEAWRWRRCADMVLVMAAEVRGLQGGEEALEVVGEGDLRPPESS